MISFDTAVLGFFPSLSRSLYQSRSLSLSLTAAWGSNTMTECHLTRLLFSLEHNSEGLLLSVLMWRSSLLFSLPLAFLSCDGVIL